MKKNNKVKEFFKKHKKEIIVGVVSVAGTAAYFLIKNRKIKGGIDLRLSIGEDDAWKMQSRFSTFWNLNHPEMKVEDLGNLGEKMIKLIPGCTDATPLRNINIDFSGICEEV